jgi:hypothetical protein
MKRTATSNTNSPNSWPALECGLSGAASCYYLVVWSTKERLVETCESSIIFVKGLTDSIALLDVEVQPLRHQIGVLKQRSNFNRQLHGWIPSPQVISADSAHLLTFGPAISSETARPFEPL